MRAMNKILYVVSAAALLSLSSCINDNNDTGYCSSEAENIRFGIVIPDMPGPATKAAATIGETGGNFDRKFKLWSIFADTGEFNTEINGKNITVDASGNYSSDVFWTTAERNQYFYALHTNTQDTNNDPITPALTAGADKISATFTYTVPDDASEHKDLLVACSGPVYKENVSLQFHHALTRITFSAKIDNEDFEDDKEIELTKIEITGACNTATGTLTASGLSWNKNGTGTHTMDFEDNAAVLTKTSIPLKPDAETHGDTYDSMFLLPHTKEELKTANVTLRIYLKGEEDAPREIKLGDDDIEYNDYDGWEPGKWINYSITITDTGAVIEPDLQAGIGSVSETTATLNRLGSSLNIVVESNVSWKAVMTIDGVNQTETQIKSYLNNQATGSNNQTIVLTMPDNEEISNKAITLQFVSTSVDPAINSEILTITQSSLFCAGYFGGELKQIGNAWQYENLLYVQSRDPENTMLWFPTSGTLSGLESSKRLDNGKEATYDLSKLSTDYEMAYYCFSKNSNYENIHDKDNTDYIWYLPAQNQLMALWIVNEAMDETKFENPNYYYSSTELLRYSSLHVWYVQFNGDDNCGGTGNATPYNNAGFVRCVRE